MENNTGSVLFLLASFLWTLKYFGTLYCVSFQEFQQMPQFIFTAVTLAFALLKFTYNWDLVIGAYLWNIGIWFSEQLMTLIAAAREHEIEFIYAISPGLDITFSNPKEVSTLKRKLDQVNDTRLLQLHCYFIWKLQCLACSCTFFLAALMFSALALVRLL